MKKMLFILIFSLSYVLANNVSEISKFELTINELSEDFKEFIKSRDKNLNYIPKPISSVNISKIKKIKINRNIILPKSYDLRDKNGLTPVKHQGSCGACWAFSGIGMIENSLKYFDGIEYDFSENHLKHNIIGFDYATPCGGGNMDYVLSYLTRGKGLVSEDADPYVDNSKNANDVPREYFVEKIIQLPVRKTIYDDLSYLKELIYQGYSIYVSLSVSFGTYGESSSVTTYDSDTYSMYTKANENGTRRVSPNHTMVFIGWDDNYEAQGQIGAFIAKNSWGEGFGENGFFYIPYSDGSFGFNELYYMEPSKNKLTFDLIRDLSPLGATANVGYYFSDKTYGVNKFVTSNLKDEIIKGLGIHSAYDTTATIKIYLNKINDSLGNIRFNNSLYEKELSLKGGWQVHHLDEEIIIPKNTNYYVEVAYTSNPDISFNVLPIEYPLSSYSSSATSNRDESFMSSTGIDYTDMYDNYPNSNFTVKSLNSYYDGDIILVDKTAPVIKNETIVNVNENQINAFTISATDENAITYGISGIDSNKFNINSKTGLITFIIAPDFETKSIYYIDIIATDNYNNTSNKSITIFIKDIKEDIDQTFKSNVAKLYVATFNRAPDSQGLDYWVNESGLKLSEIAQSFFEQPETQNKYPNSTSNRDFVKSVYNNLFNRDPDSGGLDYWVGELDANRFSKNRFIEAVINGAKDNVDGLDKTLLENKNEIGLYFANAGMSNMDNAKIIMKYITSDSDTVEFIKRKIDTNSLSINVWDDYNDKILK